MLSRQFMRALLISVLGATASPFSMAALPEDLQKTSDIANSHIKGECQQQFADYLLSDNKYKAFAVHIAEDGKTTCASGKNTMRRRHAGYNAIRNCEVKLVEQGLSEEIKCALFAQTNWLESPFSTQFKAKSKPTPRIKALSDNDRQALTDKTGLVLQQGCRKFFQEKYLKKSSNKAFGYAVDADGNTACSYASGQKSVSKARSKALAGCERNSNKRKRKPKAKCQVFAVNHDVLLTQKDYAVNFTAPDTTPLSEAQEAEIDALADIYMSMGSGMNLWGYTKQDGHKAFYYAQDESGRGVSGRASKRPSEASAHKLALADCNDNKADRKQKIEAECLPFMVGNQLVADLDALGWSQEPDQLLRAAITNDRIKLTKQLLAKGADHTIVTDEGATALSMALLHGELEMTQELLDKGLSLEQRLSNGAGAFHLAAAGDNTELLELLVKKGFDIDAQDNEQQSTPLHYAAARASRKSIFWLLAHGADDSLKDSEGKSGRDAVNKIIEVFGFEKDYFDKPDPND